MKLIYLIIPSIIYLSLTSCFSPALITSISVATKAAESAKVRKEAKELDKNIDTTLFVKDSIYNSKYATYYIYRSGSLAGCISSYLIYDNTKYVGVSNIKTFIRVDSVLAGPHTFKSDTSYTESIVLNFEAGKTYLIKSVPSDYVMNRALTIMDKRMINLDIKNHKFFQEQFQTNGLKVEDF